MSSIVYAIVFKGEILEGFKPISVKSKMAKLLKADADRIKALFSGKQVVLKRTADKAEAAKYANVLKKIGADIKVKGIKSDAAAAKSKPKAQPKAAEPTLPPLTDAEPSLPPLPDTEPSLPPLADAQPSLPPLEDNAAASEPAVPPLGEVASDEPPAPDTSAFSLAPNEGNIVEPAPEPPPPDIDLSGIEVAENDGTPLVEPEPETVVEIDLSEYSVSENDGSPLVEASDEEVPEVAVPDFGLDEPGAVLETIQEEKELLNPNTTGMTLAMAGADLLEEDEKEQEPPPPAPDTSSIHLVPNFDV